MQKIIRGTEVSGLVEAAVSNGFSESFCIVKKGHEECGDSAFVYADEDKAILAVFDGVSGEEGASAASSVAAESILSALVPQARISEGKMKEAVLKAHGEIKFGLTTAAILFLEKSGSFLLAGVGDSPVYGINRKGQVSLELPLARNVGDKDSILKFFYFRNLLTSALGGGTPEVSLNLRKGKLGKGEVLILASDGLADNLFVATDDGYVTESSGLADLSSLIGKRKEPEKIVRTLFAEISKRLSVGRVELRKSMLVPKEDDIAIIAVRMKGPMD